MQKGKPQGSFGIPSDMQEEIEKSRRKAAGQEESPEKESKEKEYTDSESIPEDAEEEAWKSKSSKPSDTGGEASEEDQRAEEDKLAAEIREDLDVELDEDDVWALLYKNNLEKRNVCIVPGKMYVTFKTISMKENDQIQERMGKALDEKMLEAGYRNLNTKLTLSFSLLEIGRSKGKLKSFGKTPEERYDSIQEMNTLLVEKLSKKWNSFVWLVNYTMTREMDPKKS